MERNLLDGPLTVKLNPIGQLNLGDKVKQRPLLLDVVSVLPSPAEVSDTSDVTLEVYRPQCNPLPHRPTHRPGVGVSFCQTPSGHARDILGHPGPTPG